MIEHIFAALGFALTIRRAIGVLVVGAGLLWLMFEPDGGDPPDYQ